MLRVLFEVPNVQPISDRATGRQGLLLLCGLAVLGLAPLLWI